MSTSDASQADDERTPVTAAFRATWAELPAYMQLGLNVLVEKPMASGDRSLEIPILFPQSVPLVWRRGDDVLRDEDPRMRIPDKGGMIVERSEPIDQIVEVVFWFGPPRDVQPPDQA